MSTGKQIRLLARKRTLAPTRQPALTFIRTTALKFLSTADTQLKTVKSFSLQKSSSQWQLAVSALYKSTFTAILPSVWFR
jgi:hypothetical protein